MKNMFFVEFEDGMWMIRQGRQYVAGCETRAEAIDLAVRRANRQGFATQVLVAGEDRLFQTVWAGGQTYLH